MLNGKYVEGNILSTNVDIYIDGNVVTTSAIEGYEKRNGDGVFNGAVAVPTGRYLIEGVSDGVTIMGMDIGSKNTIKEIKISSNAREGNAVYLKTVPSVTLETYEEIKDYDGIKAQLSVFKEAEDYEFLSKDANAYATRQFLSGGKGVQNLNTAGQRAEYIITVPEDGVYDLVVKSVQWEGDAKRLFTVGGTDYIVPLAPTSSWGTAPEQWVATKLAIGVELKAGENTVIIEPHTLSWNYDWFGFVKR